MTIILEAILAYLINLASGERSAAIAASRMRKLKEALEQEESLKKALASTRSVRDEVRATCIELARSRTRLGVTPQEEPVWRLLSDDSFQADLAEWLMAGAIVEGNVAKDRLLRAMELALSSAGENPEQISFLKTGYFDALEKAVFASPLLAHWRHQLSLDYLREQVAVLRQLAEEAAGVFSPEKQKAALDHYCDRALDEWDIIDLSNLPADDIDIGTQQLLLRQLYMPLRIEVEPTKQGEGDDAALARLEAQRDIRRHREAGHLLTDEPDHPSREISRAPVGERLAASSRLVVLGDPGGGKTTMLRWMATAYLLRHKGDVAFSQVPDTQTLPNKPWIPVLIRCRDLGEPDLCRCFTDFLTQHLNKTELLPEEAEVMRAVILDRIAKGEALLLVDGLDEITNPRVRMMFCQELERTTARYPDAPVVVTSRIVGYRDMPYRMGSGFEHGQIAELSRKDKDLFARRWVEITEQHQSADEKAKRAQELLDALHSNDRIERLTGNPMLLTTLALVKRKVGKLPNKRTKLYAEAVSVLLNWNPRIFQVIEEDEAIPQLEYLAFEMCRRGVQRLAEDEVLDLLDKLRVEYPNIRAIKRREAHVFLKHLEERSSILIKSGGIWQKTTKEEKLVWEFRHLTFQEYLAARALLDGRYPGRDKTKSLAEQVAPLAGTVQNTKRRALNEEGEIPESWREALRLLVADCKDDDVDDVLVAILKPLSGEDATTTARSRTVLAALCLADEPNVSPDVASSILVAFAKNVQEGEGVGHITTSLERAAIEVAGSIWTTQLKRVLIEDFIYRTPKKRANPGGLWATTEVALWKRTSIVPQTFFAELVKRMKFGDRIDVISAALTAMEAAFEGKASVTEDLIATLVKILSSTDLPACHASAWALGWLNSDVRRPGGPPTPYWRASGHEVAYIIEALNAISPDECKTVHWLAGILGRTGDNRATPVLLHKVNVSDADVQQAVIGALGQLGDKQAVAPLLAKLDDQDKGVRQAVIGALGQLGDKQAVAPLLAKLDDKDSNVRQAVIGALVKLGDKQAVPPLLAKLDDQDTDVQQAVIEALGQLGDQQAVAPLLAKLDDQAKDVRRAVIGALGRLGDKQAVAPLLAKLDDQDAGNRAHVAAALHSLGDPKGTAALRLCLTSTDAQLRTTAIHAFARQRDFLYQRLLSRDIDAADPWLDPHKPITDDRVTKASSRLNLTPDEVRSRYEGIANDLGLKLSWK